MVLGRALRHLLRLLIDHWSTGHLCYFLVFELLLHLLDLFFSPTQEALLEVHEIFEASIRLTRVGVSFRGKCALNRVSISSIQVLI